MEARDQPWSRTQVNPCAGWFGPGKRAWHREAQYPTVAEPVVGAAITGSDSPLPQEVCAGPHGVGGSVHEGNDVRAMSAQKSDHPVLAMKPGNAGRAKGVTS
jgi:hypothetical protein